MVGLTPCYAYINAKIMPVARGKIFETPLDNAMKERGIGQAEGGGTLQAKDGEIIHCGVDVDLCLTEANIKFVCDFLTIRGAPRGSKLQFPENDERVGIPFGEIEGIAVYLNGTDLPDEVYRTSDINVVMESFDQLTIGTRTMQGYWRGNKETALYLYGPSSEELTSRISGFMSEYPLCQKARVVKIA